MGVNILNYLDEIKKVAKECHHDITSKKVQYMKDNPENLYIRFYDVCIGCNQEVES